MNEPRIIELPKILDHRGNLSTLVNIIAGLLDANSGTYAIDGNWVESLDKYSFQKKVGYISQETVIFNASIFDNVTLWDEPTEENILRFEQALSRASLTSFVDSLQTGKETELGNNGINLSGGQKQRISIARELYKDVDILILDEATSALDSETEKIIQENIDALKGQFTIIIIAHRLATIRNADKVVLMSDGKIVSQGDFDALKESSPKFKKMVQLQEL